MRNSIATYKESLSRIASEVLDAEDELEISQSRGEGAGGDQTPPSSSSSSGRRAWRRSARFTPSPVAGSPVANGTNHGLQDELAKYEADIKKLQASEAEIKALSFNYAAMLKEKEEQLSKLREENVSLRKSLEAKNTIGHASRDENRRKLPNSLNTLKGTSHFSGNHARIGNGSKLDGYSNGERLGSQMNDKESTNFHEENRSLAAPQINLESEIKELRAQLDSERENSTIIKQKLQEERQLKESSQKELYDLKMDKERALIEGREIHKELNEKTTDLRRLQAELNRRDSDAKSNESLENSKNLITILEEENAKLKMERDELEANLKLCRKSSYEKTEADDSDSQNQKSTDLREVTEKMTLSMRKLEETLRNTCNERDRALHELARLKQHLLEKELEDSDKMDEDSKIIEELQANCEYQRAQILQLEKALKQEIAKKEELKNLKSDELNKSNEIIDDLRQKLANCLTTIESKNVELLNFQTALGQYYAEYEAKEQLGRDLAVAREESAKLSESLKVASQEMKILKKEKEETAAKLSETERMLSEGKRSMLRLEEENSKLRRILEQSMTRLNRMSLDSDNYVDRRIVIKLLVTYFQRNHSREVLDLMVRMLGFSDEDKQRIGFAQNTAGKGVVRGVLGLPGRFVGGILRGSSPGISSQTSSENQSFADLWVDFLLKETEERERKEAEERERSETSKATRASASEQETSGSSTRVLPTPENGANFGSSIGTSSASGTRASGFPTVHSPPTQTPSPLPSKLDPAIESLDAEFATVPLTSSGFPSDRSSFSRYPPRY